ncbi:membrane protein [Rhodococcus phage GuyFagieri]|nr:membrane protein [Rhodococcus phage GuyFagieri]
MTTTNPFERMTLPLDDDCSLEPLVWTAELKAKVFVGAFSASVLFGTGLAWIIYR